MGYIYKIWNDNNDKLYIGQTRQTVNIRWKQHKNKAEYERQPLLIYRAMRKYGIDTFHIETIEECDNSLLNQREIYWIQYYNSCDDGYNLTYGGDGGLAYAPDKLLSLWDEGYGVKFIAKQINKGRNSVALMLKSLGVSQSEILQRQVEFIATQTRKPVAQLSLSGNIIAVYPSVIKASEITGFCKKSISACARGEYKTSHGFKWEYIDDNTFEKYESEPIEQNIINSYSLRKQKAPNMKAVVQLDNDDNIINIFATCTDAAKEVSVSLQAISMCCHGKTKTSRGFKWRFATPEEIENLLNQNSTNE